MSERRFSREEAMDALMAAASRADGAAADDSVSESELISMAGEMGVDSARLREVLARGTGSIQVRDDISKGWAWPGNEVFERIIDGEVKTGQLEEIADLIGARYEDVGTPGVRETREFWEGFRYVTVDVSVREGRTRILARSKISTTRLAPFFPFLIFIPIISLAVAAKKAPGDLDTVIQGVISLAALLYFGVGWGMRGSRTRIEAKVDQLAARIQEEVKETQFSGIVANSGELQERVKE